MPRVLRGPRRPLTAVLSHVRLRPLLAVGRRALLDVWLLERPERRPVKEAFGGGAREQAICAAVPEPAEEHVADWRLILNTTGAAKVARLLKRLEETLGVPVETIDIKPYWKQPGTTEALVRTGLEQTSRAEVVFEILLRSSRLVPRQATFARFTSSRSVLL